MANHTQRNLLHAYLDDELDLVRSMELEDHLLECGDCAREAASYRALKESLQASELRYSAPPEFRERLLAKLKESEQPPARIVSQSRSIPLWSWASVAARDAPWRPRC